MNILIEFNEENTIVVISRLGGETPGDKNDAIKFAEVIVRSALESAGLEEEYDDLVTFIDECDECEDITKPTWYIEGDSHRWEIWSV